MGELEDKPKDPHKDSPASDQFTGIKNITSLSDFAHFPLWLLPVLYAAAVVASLIAGIIFLNHGVSGAAFTITVALPPFLSALPVHGALAAAEGRNTAVAFLVAFALVFLPIAAMIAVGELILFLPLNGDGGPELVTTTVFIYIAYVDLIAFLAATFDRPKPRVIVFVAAIALTAPTLFALPTTPAPEANPSTSANPPHVSSAYVSGYTNGSAPVLISLWCTTVAAAIATASVLPIRTRQLSFAIT